MSTKQHYQTFTHDELAGLCALKDRQLEERRAAGHILPPSNKIVPIDGYLDPAENILPYPLNAWDQNAVVLYEQAHAQSEALKENKLRAENYINGTFKNWFADYDTGRVKGPTGIVGDPDAPPPTPPLAVHVKVVEIEGSRTYDYPETTKHVCPIPPYKKIGKSNVGN